MSIDLTGKLYKDMSDEYKDAYTRDQFKTERKAQTRMAGDAMVGIGDFMEDQLKDINVPTTFPDGAPIMDPDEDSIYSYDTSAFGAGSGKDTERLSRADIKNLHNQGYSKADIVDYADNIGETGVITDGTKAQNLLDKYRKSLLKTEPVDPIDDVVTPIDPIDPIDPIEPPPAEIHTPPVTQIIEDNSGNLSPTVSIIESPRVDISDFIPSLGTNINQSNRYLQSIIQDNDVYSQVYGNGNTTTINQNNSANNYGGNQYNFTRIPGYYSR